jgi:signal transduction histidine kinase
MRFWAAALPAIGIVASLLVGLLVASGIILRWRAIASFVRRAILRCPQYDYRRIIQEHLERFNAITDRRELYPAILATTCRIIGAEGASLIVRDAQDRFQMKASMGLRPMSFDVEEVRPFLAWLDAERYVASRADFMSDRALAGIKSEALRYCVRFNCEVAVPLVMSDRLYAVINLGARRSGVYDEETRDLLRLLAVQFATAIHNANLYQALVKQNIQLQEGARLKTQLLANLSHELRTPLTSVIAFSELMAEGGDGPVNEEQVKHLSLIRQSGVRLLDTVTAMMDLSKLEVNRLELAVQKVNLGRLITEIAEQIALNKGTQLEIKLDEGTPGVYGDEERLRQIFKNLLENAAKFTRRGRIIIGAEKCGEMLRVSVRDTGLGIPPDKHKAIFEGFIQLDGGPDREHEGLGLGLAISKKLVELHGGRMWLQSKPGRGSIFNFTLPLKPSGVFGMGATPRR